MRKDIHYNQIKLYDELVSDGYNFFTGVPDSCLKGFIDKIEGFDNIIATHESQAVGIAVGAELAGKKTCIYLQNSGIGNLVNPITSLCIPFGVYPLFIIGHRHTLTQHKIMGEIDKKMMDLMNYDNYIIVHGDNNVK